MSFSIFFKNSDGTYSEVSAANPLPVTGAGGEGGTTNGALEVTQLQVRDILTAGFADTTPAPVTSPAPTSTTGTVPNAGSLSAAIAIAGKLVGLKSPAAWTAAALTFDGSMDGGTTYAPVYDDGVERTLASASIATAASRAFSLDLNDWLPFTHIKLRSGTNGVTVNQGADRVWQVALAG